MSAEPVAGGMQVALVGAGSLMGQELRGLLAERTFPMAQLTMMGDGEQVGTLLEYNGNASLITELDEDTLRQVDFLFVCDRSSGARRATVAAREGRAFVIDLVDAEAGSADPVVNMQVNAADLPAHSPARVRAPHQAVQALSTTLAQLAAGGQIKQVRGTVITPVSELGKPAVQELIQQTTGALNFGDKPQEVLGRQVAFNVIPHALMHVQQGWPDLDARLSAELAGILGLDRHQVGLRALLAPVFHGIGVMASVTLEPLPTPAQRRRSLGREPLAYGPLSPAELEESRSVHVVDLGDEAADRMALWLVSDNLRGGSAGNGVAIAEALAGRLRERT